MNDEMSLECMQSVPPLRTGATRPVDVFKLDSPPSFGDLQAPQAGHFITFAKGGMAINWAGVTGHMPADGTIAKCVLSNYSDNRVIRTYAVFQAHFKSVIKTIVGTSHGRTTVLGVGSGRTIATREVVSPNMPVGAYRLKRNKASFYIWNPTEYYVEIIIPRKIMIEIPGSPEMRKVYLIPPSAGAAEFGLSCTPKSGFLCSPQP